MGGLRIAPRLWPDIRDAQLGGVAGLAFRGLPPGRRSIHTLPAQIPGGQLRRGRKSVVARLVRVGLGAERM
jgi:hypothetical protein